MSFIPQYTTIERIEASLQMPIDATTRPNSTEVLDMIQEVEAEMDSQLLYRYHYVSGYVDVEPVTGLNRNTIEWLEFISTYGYSPATGRVVIPNLLPIYSIDVSGCHTRTTGLGVSGTWEVRQEGFANDFLVLKKQTKDGQELGFALYFFQNVPAAGVQRVRLSYYYGWNINRSVLRQYATTKTIIEILKAKMGASEPAGLTQFRGGDFQTFVGSNYRERIELLEAKCKSLEDKYFPDRTSIALGVI